MPRNIVKVLLIICMVFAVSAQSTLADEERELIVYNSRLVTNDKDATFIEGEVDSACGQTIIVRAGLRTIAEKQLPDTGSAWNFKIKVPAKNIGSSGVTTLFVEEQKDGKSLSKAVRVEIEYIERQQQEITTETGEYELTYPGPETSINAESTSGENLIYSSSDPDVVEVDEEGNMIAKGEGEAEISVIQIGSSEYEGVEETISVSVEEIDAYMVTFHSSDDEEATTTQIIPTTSTEALQTNSFENGSHQFLGWATEDGGLVEYKDGDEVTELAEQGENADLYAVWTGDGAAAAVAWAIDIANDDSFTYGKKPATNRIGCYFCGTNQKNKPKGYEKTYVCLTFVAAAYAHGAEDPEVYYACSHGKMPLYENDKNFSEFSCWTKVGKCKNLTIDDLEPGDVVIKWSDHNDNNGHVWMYIGGDQLVEAAGGGFTAKSISVKNGAAARLRKYGNSNKNYVMRYTGPNAQN